jgi:hypothetical protein
VDLGRDEWKERREREREGGREGVTARQPLALRSRRSGGASLSSAGPSCQRCPPPPPPAHVLRLFDAALAAKPVLHKLTMQCHARVGCQERPMIWERHRVCPFSSLSCTSLCVALCKWSRTTLQHTPSPPTVWLALVHVRWCKLDARMKAQLTRAPTSKQLFGWFCCNNLVHCVPNTVRQLRNSKARRSQIVRVRSWRKSFKLENCA